MNDNIPTLQSPLDKLNRHHGMTVPEGYFEDFATRMQQSLPQTPFEATTDASTSAPAKRTLWQKVRPYVYLAAMFAGIWCMMKVFDNVRTAPTRTTLEVKQNTVLAEALSDDKFVDQYFYNGLSDDDLMWLDTEEDSYTTDDVSDQNSSEE